MEFRKALLRAASLLALTAASQSSADAAITPGDVLDAAPTRVSSYVNADPLFELMSRTNGSFAGDTIEGALAAMFSDPSSGQVEKFPDLLAGLAGLGAPTDVLARAGRVLTEIVASAPGIEESLRESVLAQIETGPTTFKLAQRTTRKKQRDPDEVGQVPSAQS